MGNRVKVMNSQEMRMELESFVNRGLQEGWVGWPLKGRCGEDEAFGGRFCLTPAARGGLDRLQGDFGIGAISGRFGRGSAGLGVSWS